MPTVILNALVLIVALAILFGVWGGVHLLARKRLGDRKLGCRGPTTDDWGNTVCCHTGDPCERSKDTACASGGGTRSCE